MLLFEIAVVGEVRSPLLRTRVVFRSVDVQQQAPLWIVRGKLICSQFPHPQLVNRIEHAQFAGVNTVSAIC